MREVFDVADTRKRAPKKQQMVNSYLHAALVHVRGIRAVGQTKICSLNRRTRSTPSRQTTPHWPRAYAAEATAAPGGFGQNSQE